MPKRGSSSGKRKGLDTQALKQFRSDVAALKRKGIVSGKVDARSQKPTRYMRAKVKAYQDVLAGRAIAVKAEKGIRRQYSEKGVLEERGRFLIAPKEYEHQRARISRGLVQLVRPLKRGQEEYVILPFKPTDMPDLIQQLKADPTLNGLKRGDEQFSFRLFGHNSQIGFVDLDELIAYVEVNYRHLFSGDNGHEAVKHLTFQRFKSDEFRNPNAGTEPRVYNDFRREGKQGRSGNTGTNSYDMIKRVRAAQKKKAQRDRETPAQREKRLRESRERMQRHRNK